MSKGISYVPVIIALARSCLERYCRHSPRRVDMTGALCARENLILHSCWMTFSTSSCILYSCTSLLMTCWTFRMLRLCGSFTVHLIRYHILLLSSQFIFCFIATICFSASFPLHLQDSHRGVPSLAPWLASLCPLFGSLQTVGHPVVLLSSAPLGYWCAAILQRGEYSLCCLLSPPTSLLSIA